MHRRLSLLLLLSGLVAVTFPGGAVGQSGSSDSVRFRNPKKGYQEERLLGTTQESVGGIKVTANNKTVTDIAAPDIISVEYGSLPGLDKVSLDLRSAENQGNESLAKAEKARDLYAAEAKKNPGDPKTKRYLEFREAYWTGRVTEGKLGEAFKTEAPETIAKLIAFTQAYSKKNAWEVWPIASMAARLHARLGNFSDAASAYSLLARVEGMPANLKIDARLNEIEMLFRGGNTLTIAPAITDLEKMGVPKTGPLFERFEMLKVAADAVGKKQSKTKPETAVKAITGIISQTTTPQVRAAGHNILGELYMQFDLPRDAMWELLRVEVVDNQDQEEVFKAVLRLADCFQKLGDETRAVAYREKVSQVFES